MKKGYVVLLIIICVIVGFSSGYVFRDSKIPEAEVIEHSSNYEVYEEFAVNSILEIYVDTVNVNLCVLESDNQNIRMIYRPSVGVSNYEYYIENKIVHMTIDKVENPSSIVPSEREMVYLYLPMDTDVSLHYTSDSGFLDVDNVGLRNLFVNTKTGIVSLSQVDVALDVDLKTVSGKVIAKEFDFSNLFISTNTANIVCSLLGIEDEYQMYVSSNEGKVYINHKQYKEYEKEHEGNHVIKITSRFGDVRVKLKENNENEAEVDV